VRVYLFLIFIPGLNPAPTERIKIIKHTVGAPAPIRNAAIVVAIFLMIDGHGDHHLWIYLLGVVIISLALCFVA
jgi:hypothetical protein